MLAGGGLRLRGSLSAGPPCPLLTRPWLVPKHRVPMWPPAGHSHTGATPGLGTGGGTSSDGVAFENWPPLATGDSAAFATANLWLPPRTAEPTQKGEVETAFFSTLCTPKPVPMYFLPGRTCPLNSTTWGQRKPSRFLFLLATVRSVHWIYLLSWKRSWGPQAGFSLLVTA